MKSSHPLHGLVAAVHTPFNRDGSLNLAVVEQQAAHLLRNGIIIAFVGGTTGECHSLSLDERLALAHRWSEVARGTALRVSVHVGSNCLADARALAVQAQELGAISISACAPSYFKPASLDALIACCADIATAAPETPFYFYDIPAFTQVSMSMPDFLEQAPDWIPTLAGLKFTNTDLMAYQLCLRAAGGRFDVAYGCDQWLLAAQAQKLGAISISACAPSYFKPASLDALIACCADIATAAPATAFYFYDIPVFTQVSLSMPDFLEQAPDRIPTLAGLKFTNTDLMAYQLCLRAEGGRFDVAYGCDQWLLAALALGARGAVGSTYNFAAPLYQRMTQAFAAGDLATAREEQFRSVRLVQLLSKHGYMGAAKATMALLGVDVGPARIPNGSLPPTQTPQLRGELESLGFFDWIQPAARRETRPRLGQPGRGLSGMESCQYY